MTDKQILLDLAARVEAVEGPDRELADEVMLATGWTVENHNSLINDWWSPALKRYPAPARPNPLASLDAAMMLVPEGIYRMIEQQLVLRDGEERAFARVRINTAPNTFSLNGEGHAATPALALCAAALRTKAVS